MKSLFISYYHEDEKHKNLLKAWSQNDNGYFDIKFNDNSVGVSINSTDATYIKMVIKDKIKNSSAFLCLIGENTANSDWVNWEIETAYNAGKKIIAVKIDSTYDSPNSILGKNAKWAMSFKYESIKNAISS